MSKEDQLKNRRCPDSGLPLKLCVFVFGTYLACDVCDCFGYTEEDVERGSVR